MDLPDFYRFLRLRIFVLRIGKENQKPDFRIAYAAAEPFSTEEARNATISHFNQIPVALSYEHSSGKPVTRKCFIATLTIISSKEIVCAIISNLLKGLTLAESCNQQSVKLPAGSDFELRYYAEATESVPVIDSAFSKHVTYSYTWRMLKPESILYHGDMQPSNSAISLSAIGIYIAECMSVAPEMLAGRIGNIELFFRHAIDESGKLLVTHESPDNTTHRLILSEQMYAGAEEVITNVRFADGARILADMVQHMPPTESDKGRLEFRFTSPMPASNVKIKIWLRNGNECRLAHRAMFAVIKNFDMSVEINHSPIILTTKWHEKIRASMPISEQGRLDEMRKITRKSTVDRFSVGDKSQSAARPQPPHRLLKTDDAFFPKGWNPEEGQIGVHGALEFLKWFCDKAKNACAITLQDPYLEDVALYFIASANVHAKYTVITQTRLTTNPNGTSSVIEPSGPSPSRAEKIISLITSYPTLFAPMQLVIKDVTSSNNKLHDRYLFLTYSDGHSEGYALSNSLQGATTKQPLLVTRIGDNIIDKVSEHVAQNIARTCDLRTLYNYREARLHKSDARNEIADQAFMKWVQESFSKRMLIDNPDGCIADILDDILYGPFSTIEGIPAKLSTLGNLLANTPVGMEETLVAKAVNIIQNSTEWTTILSEFILRDNDAAFPIGFRNCPHSGRLDHDFAGLTSMDYKQIISLSRQHIVDCACSENNCFQTWGLHYACHIIVKAAPSSAIDILLQLRSKICAYHGDPVIYPPYLAANMLLQEMFCLVIYNLGEEILLNSLSHHDKWMRAIGAIAFLNRAETDSFSPDKYMNLFVNPDEIIAVAHQAIHIKSDEKGKTIYYKWIIETARNHEATSQVVIKECVAFLKESHNLSNKTAYVENVLVPLVEAGIIKADELEAELTDALYDPSKESETMTVLLPRVLQMTGASLNYLKTRVDATVKECTTAKLKQLLPDDDTQYKINVRMHNIDSLIKLCHQG